MGRVITFDPATLWDQCRGHLVCEKREKAGCTIPELAEMCELSAETIRKFEKGVVKPTQTTVKTVAASLGMSVAGLNHETDMLFTRIVTEKGVKGTKKAKDLEVAHPSRVLEKTGALRQPTKSLELTLPPELLTELQNLTASVETPTYTEIDVVAEPMGFVTADGGGLRYKPKESEGWVLHDTRVIPQQEGFTTTLLVVSIWKR